FVDARLTFLSVLPLPLLALLSNRLGEWMHDAFKEAQATFSELTSKVQESISGIKAIIAFGREKEDIQDFEKHLEKIKKSYTRVNLVDSLFDPLIGIIVGLSYALAIFLGGMYVANHTISIGQLVSFFSYINMLVWPLFSFGYLFNIIQRGNASLTRVEELLEAESLVNDDGVEIAENGGSLQVSVNQFSYPDASQKVLENIHFTLPYGQTLGIVGSTGSGKSTLLKQILRLYENFEGEIRYQGKNIFSYTMESYLRQIAYVPQDHQLFSGTIMENIRFGSCDATVEEVIQQAKQASIHDEIMEFPGGYQTLIGERGITLSGGQKQRISIARALLRGGSLVIMDDALSAVDAKTEENLLNKLEVGEKKSLILVAHRLSSVMKADQILVLRDGEIVQRGTHDALVQQDGWYQETWNLQKMQKGGV
ncbi:MAG: ATP-binding cassette domain-containing protein, partial [Streptococcaceae bacterium]|nr:ATP-binding cassette domain-containing protein [Streptococcaceae bacterium]